MPGHDTTDPMPTGRRASPAERVHPFLFLLMEGDRPLAGGARVALREATEVLIGRGDARVLERHGSAVSLRVPDRRMSQDHARIERGGAMRFTVVDSGSANGTRVNGDTVDRAQLEDGDLIELGQTIFAYREVLGASLRFAGDCDAASLEATLPGMATLDPVLAAQLDRLARIAPTPVPIMLLGQTGTGKEVLAVAVHARSRRPGPFVPVNCGAIPQALTESQLFGHVKGAFSGAHRDEIGFVRAAQYGTLFLDEIGDLPLASQTALLRVLQEGEVLAVGSSRPVKVDIRVVCATHQPLDELMAAGRFRQDLYARLAGFTHALPALRDRRVDIGILVAALLRGPRVRDGEGLRFRGSAARALASYDWPLNVRELEQCLAASAVLAEGGVVRLEDLPASVAAPAANAGDSSGDDDAILRRELIARLAEARGNISEVGRTMGKARQQIQRWLRRFNIDPRSYRDGT